MREEIKEPKEIEVERYTEDDYDEMLDECYGDIDVCGNDYSASYALKELDPTAYRVGFADYQEYDTKYVCPVCGDEYDDDEEAKWCCQNRPVCPVCDEEYDTWEEADNCCEDEEEKMKIR